MRTGNPTLTEQRMLGGDDALAHGRDGVSFARGREGVMTVDGTIHKTGVLVLLAIATAAISWRDYASGGELVGVYATVGAIGGLVAALVTTFKQRWAPYTAPVYALFEGLFLGAVSAMFAAQYEAIVIQAVALTFGTLFVMLGLYRARIIQATAKFRAVVVTATGAIFVAYLASWVLGMFGVDVGFMHQGGVLGIGLSVVVIGVAALNLILDFDLIERTADRAPKYMEWYAAFGLMVTLVWLYIEFLRLLSKLSSRD